MKQKIKPLKAKTVFIYKSKNNSNSFTTDPTTLTSITTLTGILTILR